MPHSGGGARHKVTRAMIIQVALQESAAQGVPVELVLAIIQHESNFQSDVVNGSSGALGLMQILPSVCRSLKINGRNWRENIEGGVRLLSNYHHDNGLAWGGVLRAYAAGIGGMDSEWAHRMQSEFMELAQQWKKRGYEGTSNATGRGGGAPLDEKSAAMFIAVARRQLGEPYVFGSEGPNQFDCSGLIYFALNKAGLNVPRSTADGYYDSTPSVSRENLRPGDLLFFHYGRLGAGQADHVGIYIGNGQVLDTRSTEHPVMIRAVDWENVIGQGRIAGLEKSKMGEVRRALRSGSSGSRGALKAAFGGNKVSRQELRGILRGYGLNPDAFDDLITQAIQQQWSPDEMAAALYDSEIFKRMFPGIFNEDGSLKMSAAEWQRLAFGEGGFSDIAKEFGINLNRAKIGLLIEGNKSPDEFAFIAKVTKQAKSSEVYRQSYSATLKSMGQQEVGKKEWVEYLAGQPNSRIENLYEAANLQKELGVGVKASVKASHRIGDVGEMVDIQDLVNQVREVQDFIQPELDSAGISTADLAVAHSGADPKGIKPVLAQLLRNRNAQVGQRLAVAGTSQGGGLFPELPEAI